MPTDPAHTVTSTTPPTTCRCGQPAHEGTTWIQPPTHYWDSPYAKMMESGRVRLSLRARARARIRAELAEVFEGLWDTVLDIVAVVSAVVIGLVLGSILAEHYDRLLS